VQAGIEQLFNQLMRPKLRTLIADIYKDVSYLLDDDGYAQADYNDIVRKRFVKAWEGLVDGYKASVIFTPSQLGLTPLFRTRSRMIIIVYSLVWHWMRSFDPGKDMFWV
jgi:hypothetical protein